MAYAGASGDSFERNSKVVPKLRVLVRPGVLCLLFQSLQGHPVVVFLPVSHSEIVPVGSVVRREIDSVTKGVHSIGIALQFHADKPQSRPSSRLFRIRFNAALCRLERQIGPIKS